jgi:hypothetical protein
MFDKKYEDRLLIWHQFREGLETSEDPIQDTIDFYNKAPLTSIAADPFTPSAWPTPWEIVQENIYCEFVKILAICYTLQLTDCLSQSTYEIHTAYDKEKSATYYLLYVDDKVIGYHGDTYVFRNKLPVTLYSQFEHTMPALQ